jgi:hypothetical protein
MHSEKIKFKISIILFLIVFSLMIFYEKIYNIPKSDISELSLSEINTFISVFGFVKSQQLNGNNLFVDFCSIKNDLDSFNNENNCIKLVMFGAHEKVDLETVYRVIGKVTYYNNELEIIVREISVK